MFSCTSCWGFCYLHHYFRNLGRYLDTYDYWDAHGWHFRGWVNRIRVYYYLWFLFVILTPKMHTNQLCHVGTRIDALLSYLLLHALVGSVFGVFITNPHFCCFYYLIILFTGITRLRSLCQKRYSRILINCIQIG